MLAYQCSGVVRSTYQLTLIKLSPPTPQPHFLLSEVQKKGKGGGMGGYSIIHVHLVVCGSNRYRDYGCIRYRSTCTLQLALYIQKNSINIAPETSMGTKPLLDLLLGLGMAYLRP